MKTSLLTALTASMWVLVVYGAAVPDPPFDLDQLFGRWYVVAMASNAPWFVETKADVQMSSVVLAPTSGGDLRVFEARLQSSGICRNYYRLVAKTETPGTFSFISRHRKDQNLMSFVEVQSDRYALVSTIMTKDGESNVLTELYSRSSDVGEELQQKFSEFSQESGVQPENVLMLPNSGECPTPRCG